MINFFRKIRSGLLNEKTFTKYLSNTTDDKETILFKKIWYLCNLFSVPIILIATILIGKSHGYAIINLNIAFILCMIIPLFIFHFYRKNIENYAFFTQLSIVVLTSVKVYFMGGMMHAGTPVFVGFIAPVYALTLPNKKRALFVFILLIGLMIAATLLNPYDTFKSVFATHILGFLIGITFIFFTLYYFTTQLEIVKQKEKERVEELSELKTKFLTHIAHEFRAPLSVIIGAVDQILEHPKTWLYEGHEIINRNAMDLIKLSNKLLELSKLETNSIPIHLVQYDITAYVQYLIESFYSLAETKNIRIEFECLSDSLIMDFDPDKFQEIFSNLLSNAIKFTARNGSIKVSLYSETINEKRQLVLIVKDNGIGIPHDQLDAIFNRFYQAKNHLEVLQEGTGLGLALTKELINLHGGEIKVESELNKGSAFKVHLPISNKARKTELSFNVENDLFSQTESKGLYQSNHMNNSDFLNILLVEDNSDVVSYLRALFYNKYNLTIVQNGKEGLSKAIEIIPDLIISDVKMADIDGFKLCKTIKGDIRTSHIPIILLTALADKESKLKGLDVGADAYLVKPIEASELFIRIDRLVSLRKKLQEHYNHIVNDISTDSFTYSNNNKEDAFIHKIRVVLESHLADEDFGTSQLCRSLGMSRSQLYRKFNSITDISVHHFLMKLKLQKARNLLQNTDLNVSQVAFETGFKNLSHFSRVFKKEFGYNPSKTEIQY